MPKEYIMRYFKSSDNEHKCALYTWLPGQESYKAVVQVLHGMREHMGRYSDFADFLNSQGIAVCGHDHLGHGKTAEGAGDFGYFGKKDGDLRLLTDCGRASEIISASYPGLPLFLFGHSMGSFLGRLLIVRQNTRFSGFICMGTGGEAPTAPAVRAMLGFLARGNFAKKTIKALNRAVISPSMLRHNNSEDEFSWLSRDESVWSAFAADEFAKPLFTTRAICDLISLQMAATSREWVKRVDKNLPVFLLSGDKDLVGNMGRGVAQTYERLKLAGCRNVRCILYEGARHELLNEINKEEVYYDISSWIMNTLRRRI